MGGLQQTAGGRCEGRHGAWRRGQLRRLRAPGSTWDSCDPRPSLFSLGETSLQHKYEGEEVDFDESYFFPPAEEFLRASAAQRRAKHAAHHVHKQHKQDERQHTQHTQQHTQRERVNKQQGKAEAGQLPVAGLAGWAAGTWRRAVGVLQLP